MPLWDSIATHVIFADDSCSIVSGDDLEQLNNNIRLVAKYREEWYRLAGFSINGKKRIHWVWLFAQPSINRWFLGKT